MTSNALKLTAIKTLHTVVWAVFASSIVAIPVCAYLGLLSYAWYLIGFVMIEVVVLFANRMRCPLTDVAGRYTTSRHDNFDIYLPLLLARYNKLIFGSLFILGVVYVLWIQFVSQRAA